MSRLAYHTDKCSFTTKKKIMRERKRDREKKKGRERKRRKGQREREKTGSERDFTVGRWNCLISVYRTNCTKII